MVFALLNSSHEPPATARRGQRALTMSTSTADGRDAGSSSKNRALAHVKTVLRFVLAQWLIIGFGIACVLAYYFPCEFVLPCVSHRHV